MSMNELDNSKRPSAKDSFTTSYVTLQWSITEDYAAKASALLDHSWNFITDRVLLSMS